MKFQVLHYDDRHFLLGLVDGRHEMCDPYVGCAISNSITTELEGRTLLLPDDCNRSSTDGCLLPSEGEVVIL